MRPGPPACFRAAFTWGGVVFVYDSSGFRIAFR